MSMPSPRPYRLLFIGLSLLVLLSGCATEHASKSTILWHSRERFVAAVDRDDQGAQRTVQNRHPAVLAPSKVRAELATLIVKLPGEKKPVALFGAPDLQLLSEQLCSGFKRITPDQDLIFAIYSERPLLGGLGGVEVVTTGRAFYREGRLNLILGMVREDIRETDRRLQPFTPGSRVRASQLPGPLTTSSPTAVFADNRPEWVMMTIPEGEDAPRAAQPQPEPPSPVAQKGEKSAKGVEERLRLLGELKGKGLISEEEYRQKREAILNEL